MNKQELAKQIFKACYLQGEFKLRSGQTSSEYFDKYLMEASPEILKSVAEHLAPLIPKDTEILAALEMGAIPIGTALSLQSGIPLRFVRKKAKDYGTENICEGGQIEGKKVCVVEDVVTTGGQIIESVKELRAKGARIDSVLCAIYRGSDLSPLKDIGLELIPLFTKEELKS